ncbi:non-canonical purine NTP pyrophosphatase [Aminivibrio sp.]
MKNLLSAGLLFASGNRHKYGEVAELFAPLGIPIIFGPDRALLDVEEDGTTYASNAYIKARAWAEATGLPSLADDSGVEVRALDWRPGIFSARMAEDDPGRVEWMLHQMRGETDRYARYVAAFALCFPREGFSLITEGVCPGEITENRGGGFGYDPVFRPLGQTGTFGEISREIKAPSPIVPAGYAMMDILSHSSVIK